MSRTMWLYSIIIYIILMLGAQSLNNYYLLKRLNVQSELIQNIIISSNHDKERILLYQELDINITKELVLRTNWLVDEVNEFKIDINKITEEN